MENKYDTYTIKWNMSNSLSKSKVLIMQASLPEEQKFNSIGRIIFSIVTIIDMWRFIDVQADWRSWIYGRAPNAIDIS